MMSYTFNSQAFEIMRTCQRRSDKERGKETFHNGDIKEQKPGGKTTG